MVRRVMLVTMDGRLLEPISRTQRISSSTRMCINDWQSSSGNVARRTLRLAPTWVYDARLSRKVRLNATRHYDYKGKVLVSTNDTQTSSFSAKNETCSFLFYQTEQIDLVAIHLKCTVQSYVAH